MVKITSSGVEGASSEGRLAGTDPDPEVGRVAEGKTASDCVVRHVMSEAVRFVLENDVVAVSVDNIALEAEGAESIASAEQGIAHPSEDNGRSLRRYWFTRRAGIAKTQENHS
jgi:hypothetical protein